MERLRWQLAIYTGVPAKVFRGSGDRQLLRMSRKLSFLKTAVPQEATDVVRVASIRYDCPTTLGEQPLAQWVTLEQRILKPPNKLQSLAEGELGHLPELLACLLTPVDEAFDSRTIDSHAKHLRWMPISHALGLRNWFFEQLQQIEQQYEALFAEPHAPDTKAAASDQALYFRRWGWSAILAELNGGQLLPDTREMLLQTPVDIIFQELARRQHKAQIDEHHLKTLKHHANH